ncbi:hypothetical protein [Bradyrhizobium sp. Tv2a-2]|uniref:hypothetical protein n=1 Tax=Bradyrhizobium sp. Tv2a-2 TaxID=113395 RepID=UPI000419B79B|nr:hypothetical protein [Bradyrhizobium sp. Tv2a-2]
MSRHHILPPIVYTPEPPKPKEARRRRRVGYAQSADTTDEATEVDEAGTAAPVYDAALPQHSRPVEAVERRASSTTGKLSEDTLKALLAVQEESGQGVD